MRYKIKSLPLLKYYGEHRDESDFYFGFKKRLIANEYAYISHKSGTFEQFYYQVIIFEKLEKYLLRDTAFLLSASKEKLTQLLIAAHDIINKVTSIETEINQIKERKFSLTENYFRVINSIELYILKLISFLDILSKISAYFFKLKTGKNIPKTYGKQKALKDSESFKYLFDLVYQRRLLKNRTINNFLKYRNKFIHQTSLKLIPYSRNNKFILTFSEGSKEGIKIKEGVTKSIMELSKFINFFEKYYLYFLEH